MMFLLIYFTLLSLDFGNIFDFSLCVIVSLLISPRLFHFSLSYFASFHRLVMFPRLLLLVSVEVCCNAATKKCKISHLF